MTSTFFNLPPELQLLIKECISPTDLRTHVCLYLSDPECASLYDSLPNPDSFWKLICWNNGLGQLPHDSESTSAETDTTWRDVATSTILADGFCAHPQCGEALLAYNRAQMREATQRGDIQPFSPLHITSHGRNGYGIPDPDAGPRPAPHRVLTHISFRPNEELRGWGDPSFPAERDAHLRPASEDAGARVEWEEPGMAIQRAYVWRHALVARSFATFAPSASVVLYHVARIDFAHGRVCTAGAQRAVTVMDVLDLIQKNLNLELMVHAVSDYLREHEGCQARHEWARSMHEIMWCLRTLRLILSLCPIRDVEFEGYTSGGPAFRIDLQ